MKTKLRLFTIIQLAAAFAAPAALRGDTPPEIIDPPLTRFAWLGRPVTLKVSYTNKTAMKDGRLILARGYGYADPENSDEPAQPDSLFHIASLSKAITATAVLKFVDDSRLNLDDPVFPMLHLPSPTFPDAQTTPHQYHHPTVLESHGWLGPRHGEESKRWDRFQSKHLA